jgi:hypothetical protein
LEALAEWVVRVIGLTVEQQRLIVRVAWVSFMTFHVFWACGWLTVVGLATPFASASEVKDLVQEVRDARKEALEKDLIQIRGFQCRAETQDAKQNFTIKLQELIDRYYDLTRKNPWIPDCRDVQL